MKVLIVSDNHGSTSELRLLKEKYATEVDAFFHCGDSELSSTDEEVRGYYIVRGNCDYGVDFPVDITKDVQDTRFYVTHGHLYGIKTSLQRILYRAVEVEANIVCFGHSHVRGVEMIDGILFVNPGSILLPRLYKEKTYALIEKDNEQMTVRFLNTEHEEIDYVTFSISQG
ncbi:metallophosphoesterase [Priestia taiwanensis]|uniref:Phosphoesterase n=1 Tax=Priestia taiwanensis TaxID=1347902 RepID=A0A917ESZ4_9BACI|nr:metallophosphoesterase [Priestia taiwanensis]MBM7363552.1 putative phosphoesterase [Priestia taiwanensis]GGE76170.1 phosphoesterase [Priestia taiwanensis]